MAVIVTMLSRSSNKSESIAITGAPMQSNVPNFKKKKNKKGMILPVYSVKKKVTETSQYGNYMVFSICSVATLFKDFLVIAGLT